GTVCGSWGCANLVSSPENCGGCGVRCDGRLCSRGTCADTCEAGLLRCGRACVDPGGDSEHCGGCGQACPPGTLCASDRGAPACRAYRVAPCATCPCDGCGNDRVCCEVPSTAGTVVALCVSGV